MSETVLNAIVETVELPFTSGWVDERQKWGEAIQLYRDYVDGDQRLEMTQPVADLLMIEKTEGERFVLNYSELVMQRLADRLEVVSVAGLAKGEADDDDATDAQIEAIKKASAKLTGWADRFKRKVRFDGLQIDNHEDTITAGDSFVMIGSKPLIAEEEFPAMIVEPAYNGETGIVPIYDTTQRVMMAVVKIWESFSREVSTTSTNFFRQSTTTTEIITEFRVNIYYPDRIEKYVTDDGKLKPFFEGEETTHITPWLHPGTGQPLGIPFVHFKNGGRSGKWNGKSAIKSAIPVNDIINNSVMNMTLITRLTGTMIRWIIGAKAPDGKITPGMFVEIAGDGVDEGDKMPQVGSFKIGEIGPVIEEAEFAVEQLANVTDTPLPNVMGSSASSGESLKQREIGFVARAEKLQTKWGNSWEDVFMMGWRIQDALGKIKPPPNAEGFDAIWKPAEIRNDSEIVEDSTKIAPFVDRRTVLEEFAKAKKYKWDKRRIDEIENRLAVEVASQFGTGAAPTITPGSFAGLPGLNPIETAAAATVATGGVG